MFYLIVRCFGGEYVIIINYYSNPLESRLPGTSPGSVSVLKFRGNHKGSMMTSRCKNTGIPQWYTRWSGVFINITILYLFIKIMFTSIFGSKDGNDKDSKLPEESEISETNYEAMQSTTGLTSEEVSIIANICMSMGYNHDNFIH